MREIRVSPDGNAVAIRSDLPEGSWNEWGVMTATAGGGHVPGSEVADWQPMTVTDAGSQG